MNNLHDTNENENDYWWEVQFYDFTNLIVGSNLFPSRAEATKNADSIRTDAVLAYVNAVVVV